MFHGIEIRASQYLAGSKRAYRLGDGPVIVSPAMYELISAAETEAELRLLLENIGVLNLPSLDVFSLPMTTVLPEPKLYNYAAAWSDLWAFTGRTR